jgi:hypothetical protein
MNRVNDDEMHLLQRNVCYKLFGEDSEVVPFNRELFALGAETQGHLFDIAKRLDLIGKLDDPALKLYLLCTCIDSLSNSDWADFIQWLDTKQLEHS